MKPIHNPNPHVTKPPIPKNKGANKPFTTPPTAPSPLNSFVKTVFGQITQKDDQNKRSWLG